MKNGNYPAFPMDAETSNQYQEGFPVESGLTKREYFAALAMQGLSSACDRDGAWSYNPDCVANMAVQYADALIKELNK